MTMTDKVFYRMDGRVEFLCEHGVGHTFSVPEKYIDEDAWWSHTCDGCCSEWRKQK